MALQSSRDGDDLVLTGQKRYVADPEAASLFVVSFRNPEGAPVLAVIEGTSPGVEAKSFPMIDATKRMGNLDLSGVRVAPDQVLSGEGSKDNHSAITQLLDAGAIAVTAEMGGAVDAAIQLTVKYAKERIQFGHPIGHYQGVKHPLAEMYVDMESFKSLLYFAAWCLDTVFAELSQHLSPYFSTGGRALLSGGHSCPFSEFPASASRYL